MKKPLNRARIAGCVVVVVVSGQLREMVHLKVGEGGAIMPRMNVRVSELGEVLWVGCNVT